MCAKFVSRLSQCFVWHRVHVPPSLACSHDDHRVVQCTLLHSTTRIDQYNVHSTSLLAVLEFSSLLVEPAVEQYCTCIPVVRVTTILAVLTTVRERQPAKFSALDSLAQPGPDPNRSQAHGQAGQG